VHACRNRGITVVANRTFSRKPLLRESEFPQGLKPPRSLVMGAKAKAVPFQSLMLKHPQATSSGCGLSVPARRSLRVSRGQARMPSLGVGELGARSEWLAAVFSDIFHEAGKAPLWQKP